MGKIKENSVSASPFNNYQILKKYSCGEVLSKEKPLLKSA